MTLRTVVVKTPRQTVRDADRVVVGPDRTNRRSRNLDRPHQKRPIPAPQKQPMIQPMIRRVIARLFLQERRVQSHVRAKPNHPAIAIFLLGKMRWHLLWMAIYRLEPNVGKLLRERVAAGGLEGDARRKADFATGVVLQWVIFGPS